jgi:hypothetical protein
MRKRRYEILLPALYNDGRSIMQVCMDCFPQTLMTVADQFGALSYSPYPLKGVWTQAGQRFDDELFRLTVDVEDTPENQQFMARFKTELLTRFEQLEIYMVAYAVEIL